MGRAAASPARPGCALWAVSRPARTSITLPGRKVNGFFCEKGGRASLYMRVGAGKKPGFFSPGGYTCRPEPPPGSPPEPRPGTPARKPAAATGHIQPPEARRPPAGHTARPETGPAAGAHRRRPAVPGEGVVRSPCVPGGDRAPLTREFPTNSGGGGIGTKRHKKDRPEGRRRRRWYAITFGCRSGCGWWAYLESP